MIQRDWRGADGAAVGILYPRSRWVPPLAQLERLIPWDLHEGRPLYIHICIHGLEVASSHRVRCKPALLASEQNLSLVALFLGQSINGNLFILQYMQGECLPNIECCITKQKEKYETHCTQCRHDILLQQIKFWNIFGLLWLHRAWISHLNWTKRLRFLQFLYPNWMPNPESPKTYSKWLKIQNLAKNG